MVAHFYQKNWAICNPIKKDLARNYQGKTISKEVICQCRTCTSEVTLVSFSLLI